MSEIHHYHFTAPAGWDVDPAPMGSGGDVQYKGPVTGSTTANIIVAGFTNATAANTDAYLLAAAQGDYDEFKAYFAGTTQVAPRTFSSALGRAASEWSVNYTLHGAPQRIRQVIFASDEFDLVYTATFTDNTSAFESHSSALDGIVNTFVLDNAPPAPTSGSWILSGMNPYIIGVAVVALLAAAMVKRKGKDQAPPPPPLQPSQPKK